MAVFVDMRFEDAGPVSAIQVVWVKVISAVPRVISMVVALG